MYFAAPSAHFHSISVRSLGLKGPISQKVGENSSIGKYLYSVMYHNILYMKNLAQFESRQLSLSLPRVPLPNQYRTQPKTHLLWTKNPINIQAEYRRENTSVTLSFLLKSKDFNIKTYKSHSTLSRSKNGKFDIFICLHLERTCYSHKMLK